MWENIRKHVGNIQENYRTSIGKCWKHTPREDNKKLLNKKLRVSNPSFLNAPARPSVPKVSFLNHAFLNSPGPLWRNKCWEKLAGPTLEKTNSEGEPPEPLQCRHCLGNYALRFTCFILSAVTMPPRLYKKRLHWRLHSWTHAHAQQIAREWKLRNCLRNSEGLRNGPTN